MGSARVGMLLEWSTYQLAEYEDLSTYSISQEGDEFLAVLENESPASFHTTTKKEKTESRKHVHTSWLLNVKELSAGENLNYIVIKTARWALEKVPEHLVDKLFSAIRCFEQLYLGSQG